MKSLLLYPIIISSLIPRGKLSYGQDTPVRLQPLGDYKMSLNSVSGSAY